MEAIENRSTPRARTGTASLLSLAAMMGVALAQNASAQLLSDNFSDGAIAPMWTAIAGDPSVTVAETNGRLEFRTTGAPAPDGKQFAGYVARNWHLRTTSDFRVRASFRSFPSGVTTTVGSKQAVCIALCGLTEQSIPGGLPSTADVFEIGARRRTATSTNRWLAQGTIGPFGGWDIAAWSAQPQTPFNFVHIEYPSYTFTIGYEVTFYVRYDSANDKIYVSGVGYTDPDAHWMGGFTNGDHAPRRVFVGGYAEKAGTVTGADSWIDNVQVDLGIIDAAPGNVAATDGTFTDRVRVTWTAAPNATGYKVYRRTGSGSDALLATLGPATLQHDDTTAVTSTPYTYTVKTLNSLGESYGESDAGYRSVAGPTGLAASDGTATAGVNLAWNAVAGAVGYRVFRAEGAAAPAAIATPATNAHVDATAVAGTVYTYSVKARFADTDSASGASDTGWRSLPAPTAVAATDGTLMTGVTVTWGAVSGASGYRVLRAAGAGPFSQVGAPAGLTYTDASAVAGTLYSYKVSAASAAGVSVASSADSGWRNIAAPTGVSATDGTSAANVTVSWTASPQATGYKVFRALGSAAAVQVGGTLPPTPASFADATAVAGTVYTYAVRAVTEGGDSAASAGNTGWRNLPAPTGASATDGTLTTGVTVSWTSVTGAIGYRVFRAVGAGVAAEIGAPTAASFSDTSAVAGTVYTYTVKARSTPGDSAASAGDTGWRNVVAPSGVNATDGTLTTGVTVTWTAVAGAAGYRVFRAVGAGAAAEIGAPAAATFSDTTAVAGTLYSYTVKARTAAGDSVASASNTGWRNIAAPSGVNATDGTLTTGVTVTWLATSEPTGYKVFRALGSAAAVQVGGTLPPTPASFTDATAIAGTVYTYTVKAVTAAGDSSASAGNAGWRNAAAPTGIAASDGTFASKVRIEWTASPESTVTGYRVLRKRPTDAAPVQIAVVTPRTTVAFDDTTIAIGVIGTYTVQAQTAAGNSAPSVPDDGYRGSAFAILTGPPPQGGASAEGPAGGAGSAGARVDGGTESSGGASGGAEGGAAGAGLPAAPERSPAETLETGPADPGGPWQLPDEKEIIARVRDAIAEAERMGSEAGLRIAERLRPLIEEPSEAKDGSGCAAIRMLRGDVTLDGAVDQADLDAYFEAVRTGDAVTADLDRDGTVGPHDLEAVLRAISGRKEARPQPAGS